MVRAFAVFILALATVMVAHTVVQFAKKRIPAAWAMFWSGVWVVGATLTFFTGALDRLGEYVINGEGRLLVIYAGIIALVLVCYKLFMKQQRLEREISELVEELAKKE